MWALVVALSLSLLTALLAPPAAAQEDVPARLRKAYPAPRYSLHVARGEVIRWSGANGDAGVYYQITPHPPTACPNLSFVPLDGPSWAGDGILGPAEPEPDVPLRVGSRIRTLGSFDAKPYPKGYLYLFSSYNEEVPAQYRSRASLRARQAELTKRWYGEYGRRWIIVVDHEGATSLRRCHPTLNVTLDLPEHPKDRVPLGETFPVRVTVSASGGKGDLRDVTFDPASLLAPGKDSDPAFELASRVDPPPPFTLAPGERRTFDLALTSLRSGKVRLTVSVRGVVVETGEQLSTTVGRSIRVEGTDLGVKLVTEPPEILLEEDDEGEKIAQDVTLNVTISNQTRERITDLTIQGVTRLARDRSPLAARVEVLGEFPMAVVAPDSGAAVTLQPRGKKGSSVSVPIAVRVHADGRFRFEALVTGVLPDGISDVRGVGRGGDLDVNVEYLLELEIEVPVEEAGVRVQDVSFREGRPVVKGGQALLLLGSLRNLTSNSTILVDPLPGLSERNAVGGDFSRDLHICPPPTEGIELGAGHSETLTARIDTLPEGSAGGTMVWSIPSGKVVDDETREKRDLEPDEVRIKLVEPLALAAKEEDLRLDLIVDQSSPAQVGFGSWKSPAGFARWAAHITVSARDSIAPWVYNGYDGLGALARAAGGATSDIRLDDLVYKVGETYVKSMIASAEAISGFNAWARDNPEEFDEWAMAVAMTLLGRPDYPIELLSEAYQDVQAAIRPLYGGVETAYASNDSRQVARLLGTISGNVVLEVATCTIPTPRFARLIRASEAAKTERAAELARVLAPTLDAQGQALRATRSGSLVSGAMSLMWGLKEETVRAIQEVARHFGIMIVLRERGQGAIRLIDELGIAVWKPELMKPKNLGPADRYLHGRLYAETPERYVERYQDRVALFLPDADEIIVDRLRRAGVPEEEWPAVLARAAQQRADYYEYVPRFEEWRREGIDVGLNYADNGLARAGGSPVDVRAFEYVDEGGVLLPRMADASGVMKWISGDIDFVDLRFLDGSPLDPGTALQVIAALSRVAGLQHPELMTWIREGVTVFSTKSRQWAPYAEDGKALLQIVPDAAYAVRIKPGHSWFSDAGRRHWIWYDGGIKYAGLPLVEFAPFAFRGTYRPGILTPLPLLSPVGWVADADCGLVPTEELRSGLIRRVADGEGYEILDGETWRPYALDSCLPQS